MAVVSCPKCSAGLKVPDGAAGAVRCPKCTTVFQPRQKPADPGFEVVDESRPAPKPAASKKAFSLDAAVRSADPPPRRDERRRDERGDTDDRRRRDERDDTDERRRRRDDTDDRRRDDVDDYDDDRPRKTSKYGLGRPGALLIHISLGLYFGGMAIHALLVLIAWMGADIPHGMYAFAGVIGLCGWLTALVGFGLTIAGPAKGRGLAIAAGSVSLVHLVLAAVVAFNERPQQLGGGVAIHWVAVVTDLPALDSVLTRLVYSGERGGRDRGFVEVAFPPLAGALELARLILIGLLLGSLGRLTKNHRAEGQAKFGWIAAPVAVGIAMLVVLLTAVMAESSVKSAMRVDMTPPPQFSGGNFQDQVRQRNEWQQQQQAEYQRIQDRQRSLGSTLRLWMNGSTLFVYTLHMGTLVLPLLASFGVWQSLGRRR